MLSLLLILLMIPEASTRRDVSSERKIYKNGGSISDPYKFNYYNRMRQLKPGPKGGGGRSKISKRTNDGDEPSVFWWPDASYKYVQGNISNAVTYYNSYYDKDD